MTNQITYITVTDTGDEADAPVFAVHTCDRDKFGKSVNAHVGGIFDCVTVVISDEYADCWVNDEGLLIGLPLNRFATAANSGRRLVGTAVITGIADREGNVTSVSTNLIDSIYLWEILFSPMTVTLSDRSAIDLITNTP